MIVVSLLLILVAVVLLVLGLSGGSSALLIGSIVVSLLAATALVIGARQAANMRRAAMGEPTGPDVDAPPPPSFAAPPPPAPAGSPAMADAEAAPPRSPYGPDPTFADSPQATDEGLASPRQDKARVANPEDAAAALAADAAYRDAYRVPATPDYPEEFGTPDEDDPDDEPLPQAVRPADAVQVARMNDEVLVVDGRPRYHLADCPHLVGRLTEALRVAEAVELGFSPCGLCRPVDRLVARAA